MEYTYDEAQEKLNHVLEVVQKVADDLLAHFEECKRNVVTAEVNLSQLHNFGVEFREKLVKGAAVTA